MEFGSLDLVCAHFLNTPLEETPVQIQSEAVSTDLLKGTAGLVLVPMAVFVERSGKPRH